ncbi:MAG: ABC transporter substrate-binding protein [Actinomyces sp.]|nr:ABC transporter substrate-binding protein [Actinomyces sp.]
MRKTLSTLALATVAALALSGCSDPDTAGESAASGSTQSGSGAASSAPGVTPFDASTLSAVPEVEALVPQAVKERGVLRNGASTDYAPGEFRASDGQTPVGYDIDLVKALAAVMGLDEGTTTHAEFPTIIPALGTKFDVGASSFTITPERLEQVNMVSYVEVGSAYAVASGNPKNFDPTDPCGATIGVQNGTFQQEYVQKLSDTCTGEGKDAITVMPLDLQTDVSTKVIGGQYDATFADSTVIGYTVELAKGQLEQVGEVIESAPQGIAVAKDDTELAKAVQAAVQYLMDNGQLTQILGAYGAQDAALSTAELNPAVSE